jgi:hypothetical protein
VSVVTYDQLRALYRTLLVFATVGVVILSLGLVEFVYFEPPGQTSGAQAHIDGVFHYDPSSGEVSGADRSQFGRTEQFAASVNWASIPSNLTVDARWYDSFGVVEGEAGPGSPPELGSQPLVPVTVPQGFHFVLPGRYTFVVERLNNGVPVEVLGRRFVVVDRS